MHNNFFTKYKICFSKKSAYKNSFKNRVIHKITDPSVLSLNSANNEEFFGSLAAMSTAEVPAYVAAMFLMEAFGRRSVLAFCQVSVI